MLRNKLQNQATQLTVICRIEPGCLGPQGKDHVEGFCVYAKNEITSPTLNFICWDISPRYDISFPEIEYKIGSKNLPNDKAAKYLRVFGKKIEEFEDGINEKFVSLIEQYFASRQKNGD